MSLNIAKSMFGSHVIGSVRCNIKIIVRLIVTVEITRSLTSEQDLTEMEWRCREDKGEELLPLSR